LRYRYDNPANIQATVLFIPLIFACSFRRSRQWSKEFARPLLEWFLVVITTAVGCQVVLGEIIDCCRINVLSVSVLISLEKICSNCLIAYRGKNKSAEPYKTEDLLSFLRETSQTYLGWCGASMRSHK
jgi:hypothetical protein